MKKLYRCIYNTQNWNWHDGRFTPGSKLWQGSRTQLNCYELIFEIIAESHGNIYVYNKDHDITGWFTDQEAFHKEWFVRYVPNYNKYWDQLNEEQ